MGHSVTVILDNVYLDPTVEQLFNEFKKAVPELTIDDSVRKQAELDQVKLENNKIDEVMEAMDQLKEEQKRMEKETETERSENKKIIDDLSKKLSK